MVQAASYRRHRDEPVVRGTGGPAGHAQLTAWLGLVLLVLFLAQLATLFDVRGLITWHLVLGLLLVPPALVKTATTCWRMVRYYTGSPAYRQAGPPPLLLRLLGPLVVGGTLAVLGPNRDHDVLVTLLGQQVSPLTLHQVAFFGWASVTGVHVLARLIPTVRLSAPRSSRVPGGMRRAGVLLATTAAAVVTAVVVIGLATSWTGSDLGRPGDSGPRADTEQRP